MKFSGRVSLLLMLVITVLCILSSDGIVGEMISEISVVMNANFGLGKLASVLHPYPTQTDAVRSLGDEYNR